MLGIYNRTEEATAQCGLLNYAGDSIAQIGAGNYAKRTKLQIGFMNFTADELQGGQVGGLNAAYRINGVQIGGFCDAQYGNYLQLGLITARATGSRWLRFSPLIGWHRDREHKNE